MAMPQSQCGSGLTRQLLLDSEKALLLLWLRSPPSMPTAPGEQFRLAVGVSSSFFVQSFFVLLWAVRGGAEGDELHTVMVLQNSQRLHLQRRQWNTALSAWQIGEQALTNASNLLLGVQAVAVTLGVAGAMGEVELELEAETEEEMEMMAEELEEKVVESEALALDKDVSA